MAVKKSPEPTISSTQLEEHIQLRNIGWWTKQIKAGIRGPRGVITIAFALIGLPCGIFGYVVICPISAPILGSLSSYFSVRQEKEKIYSRDQGAILGLVSAMIVALVQMVGVAIILICLAIANLPSSFSSNLSEFSAPQVLGVHIFVSIVNLIVTGVAGYFVGYLSTISPSMTINNSDTESKRYPQIDQITNEKLRADIIRALRLLNREYVDVALFQLAKIFETELKEFLVVAQERNALRVIIKNLHNRPRLVDMIDCLEKNNIQILRETSHVRFLRQQRNERAHGDSPSLQQRGEMMDDALFIAKLYLDAILMLWERRREIEIIESSKN